MSTGTATKCSITHFTTLHRRQDSRIFQKQTRSLARSWPGQVALVVADGLGNAQVDGVYIRDIGSLRTYRALRFFLGSWRILQYYRRHRPQLCHFHDPELLPVFLLIRQLGARVIYDAHEDLPKQILTKHWIHSALRRPLARVVSAMEKFIARQLGTVVTATPIIADAFSPTRAVLVRNFPIVDKQAVEALDYLGYQTRDVAFAYVGGIKPVRGTQQMLEAIDILNSHPSMRLQPARLHFAGVFTPASHEQQALSHHAWQHCEFHGYLDNNGVAKLLHNVRAGLVLLHPLQSYMEAYPIKTFEYMAAGLPVISSDFPIYRDIIDSAECGLLVDPLDTQAIAHAMQWIIDNPCQAQEMGERGKRAVHAQYNWATESQKLTALYRELLPTCPVGESAHPNS